ncbi:MAG: HisS family protein, partial [Gammaproteobacteria bacterium]|nr:HisS family protein [Gammaproteobacteria bacterium]
MKNIQSVRGMNDLLPDQIVGWHRVEAVLRDITQKYGYQEIRTPMVEKTALFTQSIGDQTDIVEKEMYTFKDAGEESLTLRPESTASTVRACIQHGLIHNRQIRLWYMGPMFRRERPQRGRYRQFHQFGVEALGWPGPDIDSEIIRIGERIWRELEINGLTLEINTLGSERSRTAYRQALTDFLTEKRDQLDEVSLRRLHTNPLRILDNKNLQIQEILKDAPVLHNFRLSDERKNFES